MWANSVLAGQPIPKHNLNYSCNPASSKHRDTILHPVFSHFDSPLYLSATLETSSLLSSARTSPDRERRNKRATRKTSPEPVPLFAREQISKMARSSENALQAELRPWHTPAKGTPCPHACIDECIGKRGLGTFHRSYHVTGQTVQISRGKYLERETTVRGEKANAFFNQPITNAR